MASMASMKSACLVLKRRKMIPSEMPARRAISAVVAEGPFSRNTSRAVCRISSSLMVRGRVISEHSLTNDGFQVMTHAREAVKGISPSVTIA